MCLNPTLDVHFMRVRLQNLRKVDNMNFTLTSLLTSFISDIFNIHLYIFIGTLLVALIVSDKGAKIDNLVYGAVVAVATLFVRHAVNWLFTTTIYQKGGYGSQGTTMIVFDTFRLGIISIMVIVAARMILGRASGLLEDKAPYVIVVISLILLLAVHAYYLKVVANFANGIMNSSSFLSSFIDMTDHAKFSNIIFIVKSVLSVATVAPFGIEALKKRNEIPA